MRKIFLFILCLVLIPSLVFAAQPLANKIRCDTTNFNTNLSSADTTVQAALDTLDDGSGTVDDDVTVNSSAVDTTANFLDNIYIDWSLADGGAGGPDDITAKPNYNTASGNHALSANEGAFAVNGFVFEGATADDIELYLAIPDPATIDKTITFPNATDTLVGRNTTDTLTNKTIDATNTVTINASDITDKNAGTDITADLEEETHASEHAVGGADAVFPADPNADRLLMWDDAPTGESVWLDYSAWDTNASDDFDGAYSSLSSVPANLTSLAGLTYVSTSFVKMTSANTFALDTNTYLTLEVDGSTTNEINTITTPDAEATAGLAITFAQSGPIAITELADTITFTVTEVDPTVDTAAEILAIIDDTALNFGTGVLTAAGFSGPLTGNVTGNVSGSSGSCTGNAATVTNGIYTTSSWTGGDLGGTGLAATVTWGNITEGELADSTVVSADIKDATVAFNDIDNTPTLAGNPAFAAGECYFGTTGIIFEGSTADTIEGLLTVADPTSSDKTWTLPDTTGTIALTANNLSVFAATTSAQLYGVLSDETGSASGTPLAVFNQNPTINGAVLTGVIDGGGATSTEIVNGANPTTDAAGEIAIDSSAAPGSGIRFYGDAAYTVAGTYSKSFTILYPTASSDYAFWRTPYAITIKAVHVVVSGGTNIIGHLTECDANGANPAGVDGATDITGTTTNTNDDGTLSNPSIDANDYVGWRTTSVSGAVVNAIITFEYTIDQVN